MYAVLAAVARFGGATLRAAPWLERPAFTLARASDARPFRSARFRLFKAWVSALPAARAVRTIRLPGGVRLVVDVRDWCGITFIEPRAIEPVTTTYLLDHLRPGDVFADIGANVGYMGLQAAARIGGTGTVWCFEPNPRLVDFIKESILVNGFHGRVHVVSIALAEADGPDRPFFISADPANSGLSSLAPDADHKEAGNMGQTAPLSVPVATFDAFAASTRIEKLDAVKIDVEGAEHLVIQGMKSSLARFRPRFIVCETGLDSLAAQALGDLGYCGRMLEAMDGTEWGNILFQPTEFASKLS